MFKNSATISWFYSININYLQEADDKADYGLAKVLSMMVSYQCEEAENEKGIFRYV